MDGAGSHCVYVEGSGGRLLFGRHRLEELEATETGLRTSMQVAKVRIMCIDTWHM